MKIIYHDPDDDVIYTQIARLDFSPGVDMTLNSLPVDTLSADIITPDMLERGTFISLKDDVDTLFARYKLTKVQRVNRDTLRVEAMSALGLLDWWTVGAERINTTAASAVQDLMTGLPKSGFMSLVPYTLPADLGAVQIDGFAPEQTARERLLWLCLCMGAWVQQSFCDGLIFHPVPYFDYSQGTLIPPARTYMQPDAKLGDPVYEVQVEFIDSISTTEDYPDMQSGTDEGGVTYYWNVSTMGYRIPENVQGSEVKLSGISLLNLIYQQPTGGLIQALYQNRLEITAEVIDNGDIQPGDVVRVYTDEHLIYKGIVKQCTFSFGQQAKARLTINASPDALPIQIVRVLYTADGVPLGQHTEVFPEGDLWEIDSPEIDGYTTETPSITGSTGGTYTVNYEAVPLHNIKIIHAPAVLEYTDGSSIDFRGLRVTAYDANGKPWTNGGQWPGGAVPASALEYSATVASLEDAEEPLTYATPSGGVIVDGEEIIGPIYSVDMSAVDTPTWNDVLNNYYELDDKNKRYWVRAYNSPEQSDYTERYCLLPNGAIIVAAKQQNISKIRGYTVNPNNPDVPSASGTGALGTFYNYTHDGKTVYYWIKSSSSPYTPNPVLVKNTQSFNHARLAWYIMYMSLGDPYSGRQQIAVNVKNASDTFDITVTNGEPIPSI